MRHQAIICDGYYLSQHMWHRASKHSDFHTTPFQSMYTHNSVNEVFSLIHLPFTHIDDAIPEST